MAGWLKLHRRFVKWEWYSDLNVKVLFLHLLLKANYEPSKYKGHSIPAGSLVTGRIALSDQTGLSQQQIRTALDKLKSTSEITIKKTNKFSIITIVCWDEYQSDNQQDNQQVTNNQPTDNQQITTSKEVKKVKNDKKDIEGDKSPKPKPKTGKRISEDWKPSPEDIEHATSKGYSNEQAIELSEQFLNHWLQATGKGSTSLAWHRKWITWVANDIKWNGPPNSARKTTNTPGNGRGGPSITEAVARAVERSELRQRQQSIVDDGYSAHAERFKGISDPDLGEIIDHDEFT